MAEREKARAKRRGLGYRAVMAVSHDAMKKVRGHSLWSVHLTQNHRRRTRTGPGDVVDVSVARVVMSEHPQTTDPSQATAFKKAYLAIFF